MERWAYSGGYIGGIVHDWLLEDFAPDVSIIICPRRWVGEKGERGDARLNVDVTEGQCRRNMSQVWNGWGQVREVKGATDLELVGGGVPVGQWGQGVRGGMREGLVVGSAREKEGELVHGNPCCVNETGLTCTT